MKQLLIVPDIHHLKEYEVLAESYHLGYEYNDFYAPEVLDDEEKLSTIINTYLAHTRPCFCTMHGAFYDVIPASTDKRIREIADLRITQSLQIAKQLGVKAVIFHTNYNPGLNRPEYVSNWIDQNVAYWGRKLEEYPDIHIYLENMFETSPEILLKLSERLAVHPNYGVCLDYAHASLTDTGTDIWFQQLAKYIRHIHINDNDLARDLHLAWGDGTIDRSAFYECYKTYTPNTPILIETKSVTNIRKSLNTMIGDEFLCRN